VSVPPERDTPPDEKSVDQEGVPKFVGDEARM
jgi:hypothetical protein